MPGGQPFPAAVRRALLDEEGAVLPLLVEIGCAATVAAHPGFRLGPVDLVVEALAGLAAEDRGAERDCERRHEGDEPASGQRPAVDGKPREVQRVEHVVLRAADGRQGGDGDGNEDSPQPDADTLPGAVEARHAPGDVAAEEVADGEHDEQSDAAGQADGLRLRAAHLAADLVERERRASRAEDAGEDRRQAGGRQPAGERRQPGEAAELVLLALTSKRGGRGRLAPAPVTLDVANAGRPVGRRGGSRRRHGYRSPSPSASMRSLRTSSDTSASSVMVSLSRRTRSLATTFFSTTGRSSCSTTSCSSSEMAGPSIASSRLASVTGSRSMRTSSRWTGTVLVTFSVTTYLRRRALPVSRCVVPTRSSSSERVIARSVSDPLTSLPTTSREPSGVGSPERSDWSPLRPPSASPESERASL